MVRCCGRFSAHPPRPRAAARGPARGAPVDVGLAAGSNTGFPFYSSLHPKSPGKQEVRLRLPWPSSGSFLSFSASTCLQLPSLFLLGMLLYMHAMMGLSLVSWNNVSSNMSHCLLVAPCLPTLTTRVPFTGLGGTRRTLAQTTHPPLFGLRAMQPTIAINSNFSSTGPTHPLSCECPSIR